MSQSPKASALYCETSILSPGPEIDVAASAEEGTIGEKVSTVLLRVESAGNKEVTRSNSSASATGTTEEPPG